MSTYINVLRPWQWMKNLLIFIPYILNQNSTDSDISNLVIIFFIFSAFVSSTYVFNDIKGIWELLIKSIDGWKDADRGKMKNHTPKEEREGDGTMDHLLFWPVGQIGLAFYIVDVIQTSTS